jgi:dephospho-CoA kinase
MALIIGLAGTIASGKSTVAQLLVDRGAVHCDGDRLVHRLYEPGTPGFDRVVAAFGEDVVGPDGFIDRKKLGAKVFGKPDEMNKLTTAMGSISQAFKQQVAEWRCELPADGVGVIEAVNLMEPGYGLWCDQVWLIGVDDRIARQRLVGKRHMSEEEADQRLKSMIPFERRAPGADWIYKNDGTLTDLEEAVDEEFRRITALHAEGKLPKSVFPEWWHELMRENRERMKAAGVELADEV